MDVGSRQLTKRWEIAIADETRVNVLNENEEYGVNEWRTLRVGVRSREGWARLEADICRKGFCQVPGRHCRSSNRYFRQHG